jgi:predicted Zn-dependent protease
MIKAFSSSAARGLLLALLVSSTSGATEPPDTFAVTQRAHYAALCRARKDLDSCSDAVRWSPGDPVLVVALADALLRAGRVPEAIRDYRRAETLEPRVHGLEAKLSAAEARLTAVRRIRKSLAVERTSSAAAAAAAKRYSNADPEAQSH